MIIICNIPALDVKYKTQSRSNWWDGPESLQPALEADITTEVVIIGAGFTGLYTALQLREVGVNVVVLEKGHAGIGGSGRNSGFVDSLIGKDFPSLLKMYKLNRAKELCSFSVEAVRKLEAFIQSNQIDCDYVPNGNVNAAIHPRQVKRLQNLKEAGDQLGLQFNYLDESAIRERGIPDSFIAGIHDALGGTLDPGKLIKEVRSMALSRGVKLFEQTEVVRIHEHKKVKVETNHGSVKAQQLVLATNAFTPSLGYKKRTLSPVWAGMFETAPLTSDQNEVLQWQGREGIYTAHEKLESYRRTERNTLILGGKYVKIPYGFKLADIAPSRMADAIAGVFRQRFPGLRELELTNFWGGWIGIPLDFMPRLGVTGKYGNIHYGIGYAGHGIAQSLLVGEILAYNLNGKRHDFRGLLDRRELPIPPEPFKWLVSNAIDKTLGWMDNRVDDRVAQSNQQALRS